MKKTRQSISFHAKDIMKIERGDGQPPSCFTHRFLKLEAAAFMRAEESAFKEVPIKYKYFGSIDNTNTITMVEEESPALILNEHLENAAKEILDPNAPESRAIILERFRLTCTVISIPVYV